MPLPLIPILIVAGIGGTGFALSQADEAAEAVGNASLKFNKLMRTTAIIGAGYLAYKHRKDIAAFLKRGR